MYLEEAKEHENNMASSEGGGINTDDVQNPSPNSTRPHEDQKPRLLRLDSGCVSSIINNSDHKDDVPKNQQEQCLGRVTDTFGSVEIDFSSYAHHSPGMVSYGNSNDQNGNQSFNGGGAVSLTLGLQQHGESGVSLAFPPETQGSMFYPRDQIEEECQPVQYSLLDGEGQSMPYRNLMGTQLLHDFAG